VIRGLLQAAPISIPARTLALRAFELLGAAEASIHGVSIDEVHFHEVGAVDAIVDITCAAVGLASLNVERWYCSPVNVGSGFVNCAHGRFPVPAPATAALLRGVPTYSDGPAMELLTPTGAALLRALDCDFSRPTAAFSEIGYGAGSRNPPRFPNVVRLSVGETVTATNGGAFANANAAQTVALVECAVDDLSPQVLAHTMQLALEHGALDTMSTPVVMKKGRLGTMLTILCRPEDASIFEELLFRETSTLGVRTRAEQRRTLDRAHVTVETPYGEIRMKAATRDGGLLHAQPEYEDCRRCAGEHGVPLKQVMEAAMAAWAQRKEILTHA
jgi:pyridinium-3,5-bisthiocarboxylic acid mononucleotide nickel chelatase